MSMISESMLNERSSIAEFSNTKLSPELEKFEISLRRLGHFMAEGNPQREIQERHFAAVEQRALALAGDETDEKTRKVLIASSWLHDLGKFSRSSALVTYALLDPNLAEITSEVMVGALEKSMVTSIDTTKLQNLTGLEEGEKYLLIQGLEKAGLQQLIAHHLISYVTADIIFHPEKYNSGAFEALKIKYLEDEGEAEAFTQLQVMPEEEKQMVLNCILEHQISFFMTDKARELGYNDTAIKAIRRMPSSDVSKIFQDADKLDMTSVWGSVVKIVNDHQTQRVFYPKGSDEPEGVWKSFQSAKKSALNVRKELETEKGKATENELRRRLEFFEKRLVEFQERKMLEGKGPVTLAEFNELVENFKSLIAGDLVVN